MKQTVNQRIKILLEVLELAPARLATMLKVSPSSVSRLLGGDHEPRDTTIEKIAILCNARKAWLKTGEGDIFVSGSREENKQKIRDRIFTDVSEPPEPTNPWQDELYNTLKEQNSMLQRQVQQLTTALLNMTSMGNLGKLKAPDTFAAVPYLFPGAGAVSGAHGLA